MLIRRRRRSDFGFNLGIIVLLTNYCSCDSYLHENGIIERPDMEFSPLISSSPQTIPNNIPIYRSDFPAEPNPSSISVSEIKDENDQDWDYLNNVGWKYKFLPVPVPVDAPCSKGHQHGSNHNERNKIGERERERQSASENHENLDQESRRKRRPIRGNQDNILDDLEAHEAAEPEEETNINQSDPISKLNPFQMRYVLYLLSKLMSTHLLSNSLPNRYSLSNSNNRINTRPYVPPRINPLYNHIHRPLIAPSIHNHIPLESHQVSNPIPSFPISDIPLPRYMSLNPHRINHGNLYPSYNNQLKQPNQFNNHLNPSFFSHQAESKKVVQFASPISTKHHQQQNTNNNNYKQQKKQQTNQPLNTNAIKKAFQGFGKIFTLRKGIVWSSSKIKEANKDKATSKSSSSSKKNASKEKMQSIFSRTDFDEPVEVIRKRRDEELTTFLPQPENPNPNQN